MGANAGVNQKYISKRCILGDVENNVGLVTELTNFACEFSAWCGIAKNPSSLKRCGYGNPIFYQVHKIGKS